MLDIDLRPTAGSPRTLNLIPSTKPHCCVGVGASEAWPSRLCAARVCLCITRWRRATFEGLAKVQWAQEKFTVYCGLLQKEGRVCGAPGWQSEKTIK